MEKGNTIAAALIGGFLILSGTLWYQLSQDRLQRKCEELRNTTISQPTSLGEIRNVLAYVFTQPQEVSENKKNNNKQQVTAPTKPPVEGKAQNKGGKFNVFADGTVMDSETGEIISGPRKVSTPAPPTAPPTHVRERLQKIEELHGVTLQECMR